MSQQHRISEINLHSMKFFLKGLWTASGTGYVICLPQIINSIHYVIFGTFNFIANAGTVNARLAE